VTPASPQPLTPRGLLVAGTGWKPTSIGGTRQRAATRSPRTSL
jgi:hypothetical protein